jgi:hypothetical protein
MKAREISNQLADRVEQVVQELLPYGSMAGNYWQAGNVQGREGSSLYVRMTGEFCGKWRDAATNQHGDLLDLIALKHSVSISEAMIIGLQMIENPQNCDLKPVESKNKAKPMRDTKASAMALWGNSQPITDMSSKHGQTYFISRGIDLTGISDLRYHPKTWIDVTNQVIPTNYPTISRQNRTLATLPAVIAAIRDKDGNFMAVHRTFLDTNEPIKAKIRNPKRALGSLVGGACWLRRSGTNLIIAEGIETLLSVGNAFPDTALAAGITAHHLTEIKFPELYQKIVIAADNDDAGQLSALTLTERHTGKNFITIKPRGKDFNEDFLAEGLTTMKKNICTQLKPQKLG